jgi:hypothetical protein
VAVTGSRGRALTAWLAAAIAAAPATSAAQSLTAEADVTVGRSTDGTSAAAVQARVFGASRGDWRVFLEGAWGLVAGGDSDAFGAAYPYDRRVRPMEAYVEKLYSYGRGLAGLRAGRYRTPFGISGRSDHAYAGFLRAPLIRYGTGYALSNTFLEAGASLLVGTPTLSIEASAGAPLDETDAPRRRGLDLVVRGQAYRGSLIVGASVLRSRPADVGSYAKGHMVFSGVDGRWMHGGVQLRGEWIAGRPFDGATTFGGYVDAFVHREWMGPVTAVARVERLDYPADEHSVHPRRITAGARVLLSRHVTVHANVLRTFHRPPPVPLGFEWHPPSLDFDLAVTFSRRF